MTWGLLSFFSEFHGVFLVLVKRQMSKRETRGLTVKIERGGWAPLSLDYQWWKFSVYFPQALLLLYCTTTVLLLLPYNNIDGSGRFIHPTKVFLDSCNFLSPIVSY